MRAFKITIRSLIFVAALGAVLIGSPSVHGQTVLPKDYPHRCLLTNQEAFIVLQGGRQILVLEARYDFDVQKDSYGRPLAPQPEDFILDPPARLGWIVPLPGGGRISDLPTDSILKDLHELTHPSAKGKYHLRTGRPQGITRFGQSVFSGASVAEEDRLEWTIFPSPDTAKAELLAELSGLGLQGVNEKLLDEYTAAGWGFALAVLENPEIGGMLGPVVFEFESDRAVFPLRFQSQAGPFNLALYILSDSVLDHRSMTRWNMRGINAWENLHREAWFRGYTNLVDMAAPASFEPYVAWITEAGATREGVSFYAWEGKDYNTAGRTTERFKEEFAIPRK